MIQQWRHHEKHWTKRDCRSLRIQIMSVRLLFASMATSSSFMKRFPLHSQMGLCPSPGVQSPPAGRSALSSKQRSSSWVQFCRWRLIASTELIETRASTYSFLDASLLLSSISSPPIPHSYQSSLRARPSCVWHRTLSICLRCANRQPFTRSTSSAIVLFP